MTDDPFPRERVAAILRRLPAYLRLAWRLAREPLLSRARRAAVVVAAGYLASPVDLVPGVIPVLGQLDDLAVALAAIRFAMSGLSPERRRLHLETVGLADEELTADLRTVGATTAWLLRAGGRTALRAARVGGWAAVKGAGVMARGAVKGAGVGRRAAVKGAGVMERGAGVAGRGAARSAGSAAGAARERLARRLRRNDPDGLAIEHEGDRSPGTTP